MHNPIAVYLHYIKESGFPQTLNLLYDKPMEMEKSWHEWIKNKWEKLSGSKIKCNFAPHFVAEARKTKKYIINN